MKNLLTITELESKFKINLVKTEAETAELKYKTDELELVKIRQKYNSLLEKIRVTEKKLKNKIRNKQKNREYAGELIFFPLINEIEKNNDELGLTITESTGKIIVSLFKDNPKEVFLIELKNQITSFHKNEYLGYSITDADISSLAYLIGDHFSYYNWECCKDTGFS